MLQSKALAAEDSHCDYWLQFTGTVIMCSNSSNALAPVFKQHVISCARPLLFREMSIPREQLQNPGCQEDMT
jgi:hypothetical protein